MAHYQITYKCGHTGTINLFGPTSDREKKLEYLQHQNCPECQSIARSKYIKDKTIEGHYPDLSGTPKQIQWAIKLRISCADEIDGLIKKYLAKTDHSDNEQLKQDFSTALKFAKNQILANEKAIYFIDNRGTIYLIFNKIVKEWLSLNSDEYKNKYLK